MGVTSCSQPIPKWEGKIWAGDSATSSIQRKQDNEAIACANGAFDDYMCMSYADFQSFYETYILGCKEWNTSLPLMSSKEAYALLKSIKHNIKGKN